MLHLRAKTLRRELEHGPIVPASVAAGGTVIGRILAERSPSKVVDFASIGGGLALAVFGEGPISTSLGIGIASGACWGYLLKRR